MTGRTQAHSLRGVFFFIFALSFVHVNTNSTDTNPCASQAEAAGSTTLSHHYLPPMKPTLSQWCESGLVPDVIDAPPPLQVRVRYNDISVNYGTILTPAQVRFPPTQLTWPGEENGLYSLVMIDPDAPSRQDPTLREFLHWIIGNMPCCSLGSGEIQAQYFPAGPPKGTGLHRYALLVFRQPEYIIFHEPALTNRSFEGRPNFSARKFADKYELKLVAGNFFQAEYDPTVDELYRMVEQQ